MKMRKKAAEKYNYLYSAANVISQYIQPMKIMPAWRGNGG